MKRICIHQPDFVPYLGFFDRLLSTDLFIILDDVQFLRRGWHHRDLLKTTRGPEWLTLPVQKAPRESPIREMRLWAEREIWVPDHLNFLRENYRAARHFEPVFQSIAEIYGRPLDRLIDFNMAFIRYACGLLSIDVPMVMASDLRVPGNGTCRLVELVVAVGGSHYLTGTGALDYLEPDLFRNAGVELEIQQFHPRDYPQLHGAFLPRLSCLDLFLNCGPDAAAVLRSVGG